MGNTKEDDPILALTLADIWPIFATRVLKTIVFLRGYVKDSGLQWQRSLASKSSNYLVECILAHTSQAVLELLDKLDPPSFNDFLALPEVHISDEGVHLKLIYELSNPTGNTHWIYVGSNMDKHGGQVPHKDGHKSRGGDEKKALHIELASDQSTQRESKFVQLFQYSKGRFGGAEDDNFRRDMNTLAAAIFASILGAYSTSQPELLNSCVYGSPKDVLSWYGACKQLALCESARVNMPDEVQKEVQQINHNVEGSQASMQEPAPQDNCHDLDIIVDINSENSMVDEPRDLVISTPKEATKTRTKNPSKSDETPEARAKRLQEKKRYYHRRLELMSDEALSKFRKKNANYTRKWREQNPEKTAASRAREKHGGQL
ncbi:hypothetical protein BDW74DRAFT_115167 [Aspergillus multicolor]|uniref:uncharacterized protein n=1 Tax=Aspergillus multicolor TaxID=41759 RepID=UPI003CCC982C